jgi:hypothetical protein
VILADCNFGIFSTAYSTQQRQHPVVLRLTKARAWKLAGRAISRVGEQAVDLVGEPLGQTEKNVLAG